jgi:hypothetical protein
MKREIEKGKKIVERGERNKGYKKEGISRSLVVTGHADLGSRWS